MVDPTSLVTEVGALGLLALLVVWLTRRFNGKIDKNTAATEANTKAHEELTRVLRSANAEAKLAHDKMLEILRRRGGRR